MNVPSRPSRALSTPKADISWQNEPSALPPKAPESAPGLDPMAVLRELRRNRRRTYTYIAAFALLGLAYALTSTRLFTATTEILIDERKVISPDDASALNRSLVDIGMDPASIDSQITVVESDKVALAVLHQLHLEKDASFAAPTDLPTSVYMKIRSFFGSRLPEAEIEGVPARILEGFNKRTVIKRLKQTYVLNVSFRDPSNERAATIANAITTTYANWRLGEEDRAKLNAENWLKAKITNAADELAKSETYLGQLAIDSDQRRQAERAVDDRRRLYEAYVAKANNAADRETPPTRAVSILSDAVPPRNPDQPGILLCLLLGAVAGLSTACATSALRSMKASVLRSPSQAADRLGLPTLGILPHDKTKQWRHFATSGSLSATMRSVRAAADRKSLASNGIAVIAVVSAVGGEGRSTVARALASSIGHDGDRVLLIDMDETKRSPGTDDEFVEDDGCGFDRVTTTVDAARSFRMGRLRDILKRADPSYTHAVIDAPALSTLGDASALTPIVDTYLLVVEWGKTDARVVLQSLCVNPCIAKRTIGTVLNKVDINELRRLPEDARDAFFCAERPA